MLSTGNSRGRYERNVGWLDALIDRLAERLSELGLGPR